MVFFLSFSLASDWRKIPCLLYLKLLCFYSQPCVVILDTWAVIAYLEDEPSAQQIADLIANAHEEAIPVYTTVVNVGEVWYTIAREISEVDANDSVKELQDLRIQFVNVDWELTREAARFKSQHKMSYADCYAAAIAKSYKAELVTGDKEFKSLENQIKIQWV